MPAQFKRLVDRSTSRIKHNFLFSIYNGWHILQRIKESASGTPDMVNSVPYKGLIWSNQSRTLHTSIYISYENYPSNPSTLLSRQLLADRLLLLKLTDWLTDVRRFRQNPLEWWENGEKINAFFSASGEINVTEFLCCNMSLQRFQFGSTHSFFWIRINVSKEINIKPSLRKSETNCNDLKSWMFPIPCS